MKQTFKELYAINQREGVPGIAIGRYPEDVYSGNGFSGGNPWILTTLAVAEWHFLRAAELSKLGDHEAARAEILEGDAYVARVKYHKNADGSTSEQIHREFGHMVGARQLTWNCAAFLTTSHALNEALSSSR
jgi:glucoamylase